MNQVTGRQAPKVKTIIKNTRNVLNVSMRFKGSWSIA
jgi:hypothetical protein